MGIEEFIAVDPYVPADTEKELEFFISRFKGICDWEIHPDGDVVIKYDDTRISGELIEEVLERNGFHVKHIRDHSCASTVRAATKYGRVQHSMKGRSTTKNRWHTYPNPSRPLE